MSWRGIEKRRFIRANFPCKISIYDRAEHTIDSHTENIGSGGLRVIINEKLEISSVVGLEVHLDCDPIICKGRIVWVVERKPVNESNSYDTGIEFCQISDEDREVVNNLVENIISDTK